MHSFIPDLQINSSDCVILCLGKSYSNRGIHEKMCFADTCTKLKVQISCVVVANGMDSLLPLCF